MIVQKNKLGGGQFAPAGGGQYKSAEHGQFGRCIQRWTTYFGGYESGAYDNSTALALTNNAKLYIVGITGAIDSLPCVPSVNQFAPFYDTLNSIPDGYISEFNVNEILAIDRTSVEYSTLMVYPNPVDYNLHISGHLGKYSFEILTITGQIVKYGFNQNPISVSDLKPGMYFIRINYKQGQYSSKFIKL